MPFVEPEHLRSRAEAKAELGDDRRGLQPATRGRRGHHVAGAVDNVEMHGVANHFAEASDGRLARTKSADSGTRAFRPAHLDDRAEAFNSAGTQFERGLFADQLAAL